MASYEQIINQYNLIKTDSSLNTAQVPHALNFKWCK